MSIEIVLVFFVVNLGYLTLFSTVFIVNFEQVNTDWEYDSFTINKHGI